MDFFFTLTWPKERPVWMNKQVSYLLPASSWKRGNFAAPRLPLDHVGNVAADSGGYVATKRWGGVYQYSPAEYVDWLGKFSNFNLQWAATMDFCCEPDIAGSDLIVRKRQEQTTEMAWYFWEHFRDCPWVWVPTIQGWTVDSYSIHAHVMKPLIEEMQAYYGKGIFRVGIGTLCARASTVMIQDVIREVSSVLPEQKFHLWGVKLNVLKQRLSLEKVLSVDSAAWDVGGLGRDGALARAERQAMGMSQIEHAYKVLLPRYQAKVEAALAEPKQPSLL